MVANPQTVIGMACDAVASGKRLVLSYAGFTRVVEVHAVGVGGEGDLVMRVYQVRGGHGSGERRGWQMMRLAETLAISLIDEPSGAPRYGYRRNDGAMHNIVCQV